MKKYSLIFVCLLFVNSITIAQNVLPNGTFENWTSGTYFAPSHSFQTSNPTLFYATHDSFNCERVTDAYHGNYALKLTTVVTPAGDTVPGFFINGNANGDPANWKGGIPISAIPTGVSGYYKSAIAAGDSGTIVFDFRSGGVSVGFYSYKFTGTETNYTPFSFTFNTPISVTPDSVIFGASSSNVIANKMVPGSMLQLDSISLTGLVAQPSQLNGDFELWDSTTLVKPDNWFDQSSTTYNGVTRTTDAESGTYAIELKTTLGNNRNNQPMAIPAVLSNGLHNCAPGMQCPLIGGSPFSGLVDTLAFYYKYLPSGNDTAMVMLSFKKNGSVIGGASPVALFQSNNYQYIEIPFVLGLAPDTAVVTYVSSTHGDSLLSFAGSDLKIDSVHFKVKVVAPPSGIKTISAENNLLIYPNPTSDGTFVINGIKLGEQLRIFNVLGEEVNARITGKTSSSFVVQMPGNATGTYFVQVFSTDRIVTGKVTLNRN